MNIILLGAPGCGKGTQSALITEKYKIPVISTGDALRREVENSTEIGKLAKSFMDSGRLVPDEVVVDIVKQRIMKNDCENGFILDGFPRNINQAEILENTLDKIGKKISTVINFQIDEETLVKRISGRFLCKKCGAVYNEYFKPTHEKNICDNCKSTEFEKRTDDNEETVRNRLKVYRDSTFQLEAFYKKNNLLFLVDALKKPPLIFESIQTHFNSLIKN